MPAGQGERHADAAPGQHPGDGLARLPGRFLGGGIEIDAPTVLFHRNVEWPEPVVRLLIGQVLADGLQCSLKIVRVLEREPGFPVSACHGSDHRLRTLAQPGHNRPGASETRVSGGHSRSGPGEARLYLRLSLLTVREF